MATLETFDMAGYGENTLKIIIFSALNYLMRLAI